VQKGLKWNSLERCENQSTISENGEKTERRYSPVAVAYIAHRRKSGARLIGISLAASIHLS